MKEKLQVFFEKIKSSPLTYLLFFVFLAFIFVTFNVACSNNVEFLAFIETYADSDQPSLLHTLTAIGYVFPNVWLYLTAFDFLAIAIDRFKNKKDTE